MTLKYLVTILYQPRETMRRILDSDHRWSWEIVALASVCASIGEASTRQLSEIVPEIKLLPGLALIALSLIVQALSWVLLLFIVSWIVTPVGRLLGGIGTFPDVRAALAWAMVPMIWSAIYRIPFTIMARNLHAGGREQSHKVLLDFISHGGCSYLVVFLFFQAVFQLACIVIGSFTVGEAQRFSTQKGFLSIAITLALPVLIALAAVMSLRS